MFMPEEEQAIFERALSNAFEDLINTRPEEPILHFCKSLMSQVASEELDREMFPVLRHYGLDMESLISGDGQGEGHTNESNQASLQPPTFGGRRSSISGEALSKDELAWNPVKVEKTVEDKDFLRPILRKNILLAHLTEQDLEAVIEVLELVTGEDGFAVVAEGDIGDGCYVVEEGRLACTMKGAGLRCEYTKGDSFGELALMYGNQRAATISVTSIQCIGPCKLWKLNRLNFKQIVLSRSLPDNNAFLYLVAKVDAFGRD